MLFLCRLARDRGKLAIDCLQRLSYVASSHRVDQEPVSALPSLQFPKRGREHGCLGRASDRAERLGRAVFDQLDYRGRLWDVARDDRAPQEQDWLLRDSDGRRAIEERLRGDFDPQGSWLRRGIDGSVLHRLAQLVPRPAGLLG